MSAPRPPIVVKRQACAPGFVTVTPRSTHLVVVKLTRTRLDSRIADRHLQHETRFGSFSILPEGADCSSMIDGGVAHALIFAIQADALTSFVDDEGRRCEPRDVLAGHDLQLADLALRLERADPRDACHRDGVANAAMAHIAMRYTSAVPRNAGGALSSSALRSVRAFVFDNLASDLSLARLAEVAQLSPFHFSRAFARRTGLPPHRYVMQARTDQAVAAIRNGRHSLVDAAYAHGFTDQSHMCRWIRRRYGATPTALRDATSVR